MALVNGSTEEALSAKRELLNELNANSELTSWSRPCSFRVVDRAELETLVQVVDADEVNAELREEIALGIATTMKNDKVLDAGIGTVLQKEKGDETTRIAMTPSMLVLAFQRLVARDKQEFLAHKRNATVGAASEIAHTVARVYLLVDYPSSLLETEALLQLKESGNTSVEAEEAEELPFLSLIDGVILIADPLGISAAASQNSTCSGFTNSLHKPDVTVDDTISTTSMKETSVFQTANAFVKGLFETAQVGGAEWSEFTFTNITCSADATMLKKPKDLEMELVTIVNKLAAQKCAFKNRMAPTKSFVVSGLPGDITCEHDQLYKNYEMSLKGVYTGSVAVSTVLFAITEAAITASSPLTVSNISQINPNSSRFEEFLEYGDLAACRVANAQLHHELLQADGDPCFLPYGEYRVDDIEKTMWQRANLLGVGNDGRKGMPQRAELSEPERSVCDTELSSFFTSPRLSCAMVHRTRQLLQIEEMLGSSWRGHLQSRAYSESLARTILPQRIAQVLRETPLDTQFSYYAPTDSLLVACLPKIESGRLKVSTWTARNHVRHQPVYGDWKREQRGNAVPGAFKAMSFDQLALKSWSMYPADHSVIQLHQTSRGHVWLTVHRNGMAVGLRPGTEKTGNVLSRVKSVERHRPAEVKPNSNSVYNFIASFQDDSTLYTSEGKRSFPKKPDQLSTIVVTNSFPSGLIVSTRSDGCVIQRYSHTLKACGRSSTTDCTSRLEEQDIEIATKQLQEYEEEETYRMVYGNGSVLRTLRCGRREVLLANGIVRILCPGENDLQKSKMPARIYAKVVSTRKVDPETNALIEKHSNGVVLVTCTSGARVTYHVDGTRMYMNAARTHILVKKQSFADVCIDIKVNGTAQSHASGKRVTIEKKGLQVRSVVNVYDGTKIEIGYNTKVTAQVNGRVTTRKPSGQVIVAKDSGRVEMSLSVDQSIKSAQDDDDRDVTDHTGVYYFDCHHARFQLSDSEHNSFRVDLRGKKEEPTVIVNLAGEVSEEESARYNIESIPARAVINKPIEPYIFLLNGDGTGVEMLRPQDIADFMDDVPPKDQVKHHQDIDAIASRLHVFLRKLSASTDFQRHCFLMNNPTLDEEMLQLQRPVGVAGKYLVSYFDEFQHTSAQHQCTMVRRVEQIQPLSTDELEEMHNGWAKWVDWQKDREAEKKGYQVESSRQFEVIAQELVMQKKVLAAYKQSCVRKKMARQKARETEAAKSMHEISPTLRLEKLQKLEEELEKDDTNEEDLYDEFGEFGSDMGDEEFGEVVEVDDLSELLWSTFSQADVEGRGLLSIAQTRLGLANVLGIGVTTEELTEALIRWKTPSPYDVSFDVFSDLVDFFRINDNQNDIPLLKSVKTNQCNEYGTPHCVAGSATKAIRARHGIAS